MQERGKFVCSVLVRADGCKNEEYLCVAPRKTNEMHFSDGFESTCRLSTHTTRTTRTTFCKGPSH